jgi:adenosylcobinamide kinase / adenosylcobinamide-phosphate guanylyltransferase
VDSGHQEPFAQSPRIILIGGGVRSGKSAFAVELAQRLGDRRVFVATATRSDDEMSARIDRHRQDRRDAFATVEAPIELADALGSLPVCDVVVVDCLTVWLANLLLEKRSTEAILLQVDAVVRVLEERRFHAVLVTNEVGMSVHPPTAIGRAFVEVCGWAHQRVARAADEVHLAVLGTVMRLRG